MDLREQIRSVNDIEIVPVEVPEWKSTVYVKTMTGEERDHFEESSLVKKGKNREMTLRNIRARLVVMSVVTGPDNPTHVFTPNDIDWLTKKSSRALDRVYEAAAKLNGITASDVDELAGN